MDQDALYASALSYAQQTQHTSCAGLQRNLQIGYEAAVKLRQQLRKDGFLTGSELSPETGDAELKSARTEQMQERNPAEPFFRPWVGSRYLENEHRLLILGESHYGDESMDADSTINFTREYTEGTNHRFWTSIMQAVRGQSYWEIDRKEFWADVAFYNYVQEPVAETAGVAPTPTMFAASKEPFSVVLNRLKPKRILILSSRLWNNLASDGIPGPQLAYGGDIRDTLLYHYDGGCAMASWVPHPSYAFSWRQWHPLVSALLASEQPIDNAFQEEKLR